MVVGEFNRANSIEPSSGRINQQGSSSTSSSFSDLGLQRTITCTFSRMDVEKEGLREAEDEDLEDDEVGLG
jgi:hypothetical protein